MWQSYVNGLLVAAGLIMAIGTQNAFVLAQSLRREHHLPVAALCVTCDALLVAAGVFGLATVLAQNPTLLAVARWGGAVFLIWYGSQALRRAWPLPRQQTRWRPALTMCCGAWPTCPG